MLPENSLCFRCKYAETWINCNNAISLDCRNRNVLATELRLECKKFKALNDKLFSRRKYQLKVLT